MRHELTNELLLLSYILKISSLYFTHTSDLSMFYCSGGGNLRMLEWQ